MLITHTVIAGPTPTKKDSFTMTKTIQKHSQSLANIDAIKNVCRHSQEWLVMTTQFLQQDGNFEKESKVICHGINLKYALMIMIHKFVLTSKKRAILDSVVLFYPQHLIEQIKIMIRLNKLRVTVSLKNNDEKTIFSIG